MYNAVFDVTFHRLLSGLGTGLSGPFAGMKVKQFLLTHRLLTLPNFFFLEIKILPAETNAVDRHRQDLSSQNDRVGLN